MVEDCSEATHTPSHKQAGTCTITLPSKTPGAGRPEAKCSCLGAANPEAMRGALPPEAGPIRHTSHQLLSSVSGAHRPRTQYATMIWLDLSPDKGPTMRAPATHTQDNGTSNLRGNQQCLCQVKRPQSNTGRYRIQPAENVDCPPRLFIFWSHIWSRELLWNLSSLFLNLSPRTVGEWSCKSFIVNVQKIHVFLLSLTPHPFLTFWPMTPPPPWPRDLLEVFLCHCHLNASSQWEK